MQNNYAYGLNLLGVLLRQVLERWLDAGYAALRLASSSTNSELPESLRSAKTTGPYSVYSFLAARKLECCSATNFILWTSPIMQKVFNLLGALGFVMSGTMAVMGVVAYTRVPSMVKGCASNLRTVGTERADDMNDS